MTSIGFEHGIFPEVFCIEDIHWVRRAGGYDCHVVLYHDRVSLSVAFGAERRDTRLRRGRLVSVEWLPEIISERGEVRVGGLSMRTCSVNGFNPFQSVPHDWKVDRHQIECARDLWDVSSQHLRKLLLRTFWHGWQARSGIAE